MSFLTAATASTSKVTGISLVQAVARNGSAGVTARLYSSSGRHEKESSEGERSRRIISVFRLNWKTNRVRYDTPTETTAGKAYVIVRGMPKTMLPSDVHSRLKSIGAFKRGDIAVSNGEQGLSLYNRTLTNTEPADLVWTYLPCQSSAFPIMSLRILASPPMMPPSILLCRISHRPDNVEKLSLPTRSFSQTTKSREESFNQKRNDED